MGCERDGTDGGIGLPEGLIGEEVSWEDELVEASEDRSEVVF